MAQATRMAFICNDNRLFYKYYTFEYFGGFAITQKRKNIQSFHNAINLEHSYKILEVSRKNENELGIMLSAFNLMITIDDENYPVECIYQASKVFGDIQFEQCQFMLPAEAKRFVKENVESQKLSITKFKFRNINFPLEPKSLFYDYLYIYALSQNLDLAEKIILYDCFTDIEFNHKKQYASQARSCAIFKYLYLNNVVDDFLSNPFKFESIYLYLQETSLF